MTKGNKIMKMQFADSKLEYKLLDGEYHRYAEEDYGEYLCIGEFETSRILFQYIDMTKEPVDFIQCIIDNLPKVALDYLIYTLKENDDLLIRLTYYPNTVTSFEIYYNCYCEDDSVNGLIEWMHEHNDFAAKAYKYTEIIHGHQRCVGDNK